VPRRRLRLSLGQRPRGRPRLHRPRPSPRRRARAQTIHTGMARPPLGRRGLSLLAQPQPCPPDPLVKETPKPPRAPPTRLRPDRVQESPRSPTRPRPTEIGPKWYSVAGSAPGRAVMEGARSVQGVGARAPSSGRARAAIRELPGGTHTPLEGLCRANSVRTTAVQKGPKGRFSAPCEQPDQAEKPAQRALSRFPLPSAGASPPRRGSRTDRASAARESRARSQRTTRAARPSPRGGYSRRPL
jgi:hypothetical protein